MSLVRDDRFQHKRDDNQDRHCKQQRTAKLSRQGTPANGEADNAAEADDQFEQHGTNLERLTAPGKQRCQLPHANRLFGRGSDGGHGHDGFRPEWTLATAEFGFNKKGELGDCQRLATMHSKRSLWAEVLVEVIFAQWSASEAPDVRNEVYPIVTGHAQSKDDVGF